MNTAKANINAAVNRVDEGVTKLSHRTEEAAKESANDANERQQPSGVGAAVAQAGHAISETATKAKHRTQEAAQKAGNRLHE
jgi:ElaB/YqjD/DUF883 family membrane-anchored ribosome-binding protein